MNVSTMKRHARSAAGFLKSLGNEHRLLILCHLVGGELSVGELEDRLGLRQAHLSQQLARLRRAGLVTTRRESRTIYYGLASDEAKQMVGLLYDLFCTRRPAPRAKTTNTIAVSAGVNGQPPARRTVGAQSKPAATRRVADKQRRPTAP